MDKFRGPLADLLAKPPCLRCFTHLGRATKYSQQIPLQTECALPLQAEGGQNDQRQEEVRRTVRRQDLPAKRTNGRIPTNHMTLHREDTAQTQFSYTKP
ncbi:hypothetical protein MHYP_G00083230 [Metynnis hypsauchen]